MKCYPEYQPPWVGHFNNYIKNNSPEELRNMLDNPYQLAVNNCESEELTISNAFFQSVRKLDELKWYINFLNKAFLHNKPYPIHVAKKMLASREIPQLHSSWMQLLHDMIIIGCDPDLKNPEDGNSLLHYAIRVGSEELCNLLHVKKADIEVKNNAGKIPCQALHRHDVGLTLTEETYLKLCPQGMFLDLEQLQSVSLAC